MVETTVVSWTDEDKIRHTIMVTANGTIYHWDDSGLVAYEPGAVREEQ